MFVAKNEKGELISVLYRNRKDIEKISLQGPFFCPSCQEEVILRQGTVKIPHFAHLNNCQSKHEGESYQHLKGKVIIYDWLTEHALQPEMEVFLPSINQRADLLVNWNNKRVAVEFQCSVISVKELVDRTKKYLQMGYIPLWVINDNIIHSKTNNVLELSEFLSFFIHYYFNQCFIISLNPDTKTFYVYTNIMPFSKKRAYFDKQSFHINGSLLSIIIKPNLPIAHYDGWLQSSEKWLSNLPISPLARKNPFLQFLYGHHIHPLNLPPEVGVPLPQMIQLSNAPIEWQAYLWVNFLYKRREGESFTINEIKQFLYGTMRGSISWRGLPNNLELDPLKPILAYFNLLELMGFIQRVNEKFVIKKAAELIDKPIKNRERIRQDFFRKYKGKIIKHFG